VSPRIAEATVNSPSYWDARYRTGDYKTLDPTINLPRYEWAASLQVGDTALDIGCGEMGLGRLLLAHYPRLTYQGVDHSHDAIERWVVHPEDRPRVRVIGCDWRHARPDPATTVYLLDILEHEAEPVALLAYAAALTRRRLVVCVPGFGALSKAEHRGEHAWDWTTQEMRALLMPWGEVAGPTACNRLEELWTVDR
jgi:hypothetical protein